MRKVVLSKRAAKRLDELIEYLELEWSAKTKMEFVKKLDESIEQIQRFPNSCPQSELEKGLHMLVVSKQTSIFYRFDKEYIKIVTVFDNRMNPNKLKGEIK